MLQRTQSLYLLAGVVLSIAILFSTIFYISNDTGSLVLGAFGVKEGILEIELLPMIPVAILAGLSAVLQGFAISLFKNRSLQIMIIRVSMVITLLTIGFMGYVYYEVSNAGLTIIPFIGVFHAPLMLFADVLAIRGVKKDEALVKSVDRLR